MKFKKLLLLLPAVAITSCGYSLSYLVEGNKYNSPVFKENYYQHWDKEFENVTPTIDEDVTGKTIEKFSDIGLLDQRAALSGYRNAEEYGAAYKMNRTDELFNYGVQSKLFDGQVICGGFYQLSRVQVDEDGFSVALSKESSELTYIAMQFKTTTDNTIKCQKIGDTEIKYHDDADLFHESTITLHTSLYFKNDENKIESYNLKKTIVNKNTNEGNSYIFYGIDLREYNISRLVGFSINYTIDEDKLINWNIEHGGPTNIDYAMFLYEVFIPYTTWH